MNAENFKRAKEIEQRLQELSYDKKHLEGNIYSIYAESSHVKLNQELKEIIRKIALAHIESEIFNLVREFKGL